jgi:hypothetical protein
MELFFRDLVITDIASSLSLISAGVEQGDPDIACISS